MPIRHKKVGGNIKQLLQKYYGNLVDDLEVVEADFRLPLMPRPSEIRNGKSGDPCECPLSLCARRQYEIRVVATFRNVAYLDFPSKKDGKKRLHRFHLPPATAEFVNRKDTEQTIEPGKVYYLEPVGKNSTLRAQAKRDAIYRRKRAPDQSEIVQLAKNAGQNRARLEIEEERLKEVKASERPGSEPVKMALRRVADAKARLRENVNRAAALRIRLKREKTTRPATRAKIMTRINTMHDCA